MSDNMIVRPFRMEDYIGLDIQKAQAYLKGEITNEMLLDLERVESYTIEKNGEPLVCVGIIQLDEGRYYVWSVISEHVKREFVAIHKIVKGLLDATSARRIEAYVDCDFEQGHRWIKLLGFTLEAERMAKFLPNGNDCAMYAKVN